MRFIITRTRMEVCEKPCEEAILDQKNEIDKDFQGWFLELDSLEQLLMFIEKMGKVVIKAESIWNKEFPEIEIYDMYRE